MQKRKPQLKTLEDLIAYDGSDIEDEKGKVAAMIMTNNAAIKILMHRTEKLIERHEALCTNSASCGLRG